jgi:hypothetical protein
MISGSNCCEASHRSNADGHGFVTGAKKNQAFDLKPSLLGSGRKGDDACGERRGVGEKRSCGGCRGGADESEREEGRRREGQHRRDLGRERERE